MISIGLLFHLVILMFVDFVISIGLLFDLVILMFSLLIGDPFFFDEIVVLGMCVALI